MRCSTVASIVNMITAIIVAERMKRDLLLELNVVSHVVSDCVSDMNIENGVRRVAQVCPGHD